MMPASPADPPPSECHGDIMSTSEGGEVVPGVEVRDVGLFQDLSSALCPLELDEEETQPVDSSCSPLGELQGSGRLERRWVLWHEFMKEHAHLDTWLRLAELDVSTPDPTHVTYVTAKDELRKFERLRLEARSRLIQLDSLTRQNRALTRLFQGTMQARLLASVRECGRRWDDVNTKVESLAARLKLFVSEWEGFETEREELALWLADLDVRLTEVDQLTGNTCEKLRRLQAFQQCVCVNSARMNALLRRGESLIQQSEPTDAQHLENHLLELLRHCSLVYSNIARTHTRLLSMRLVFEDDWILSTDSGCSSESVLEEEGALDKANPDLPAASTHPEDSPSPRHLPPAAPSPSSPTHEHLGLEWDPSVDIGRSVSRDDADSSYFSASTGLCHRDGVKRWSYLSSLDSQFDISEDKQEAETRLDGWFGHAHPHVFSPVETQGGGTGLNADQWVTSTPSRLDGEPASFDGGRVRAWLGVQSPAPAQRTSCCKAVQTDGELKCYMEGSPISTANSQHHQPDTPPSPSPSHVLKASFDWMKHQHRSDLLAEEEEDAECLLSEQRVTSSSRPPSSRLSSSLLCLLFAAALVLLTCLIWISLEPPCHRSSRMPRNFHLTLSYVNGPPPT